MPIYLRRFYTNELVKQKENEQKQMDKASKKTTSSVARPPTRR